MVTHSDDTCRLTAEAFPQDNLSVNVSQLERVTIVTFSGAKCFTSRIAQTVLHGSLNNILCTEKCRLVAQSNPLECDT